MASIYSKRTGAQYRTSSLSETGNVLLYEQAKRNIPEAQAAGASVTQQKKKRKTGLLVTKSATLGTQPKETLG